MSEWSKSPPIEPGFYWWKHKLLAPFSEPKRYDIEMVRGGYWWPKRIEPPHE